MMPSAGDANPRQLPAAWVRRSFLCEKQRAAVRVVEEDRRVELLALRPVDGHDVDAS